MPRYSVRRPTKKRYRGAGIMDWVKKAHSFIKKHGLVSKGLKFASRSLGKPVLSTLGAAAGQMGYGRRRYGGALRLAGGALRM